MALHSVIGGEICVELLFSKDVCQTFASILVLKFGCSFQWISLKLDEKTDVLSVTTYVVIKIRPKADF